jgi:hypothetical protein
VCTSLTYYEGGPGPGLASTVPSRWEDRVLVQGKEVLISRSPRRKGGFTVPGRPPGGGCAQDPGKPDGVVAPSPISVDRCLVVQLADPRLASIRVGPDVQSL